MILTTIPDSTSQKFLLIGTLNRGDRVGDKKLAVIHLDFAPTRTRQCGEDDLEKWYARGTNGHECIMGHKVILVTSKLCLMTDLVLSNGFGDASSELTATSVTSSKTLSRTRNTARAWIWTMSGKIPTFQLFHVSALPSVITTMFEKGIIVYLWALSLSLLGFALEMLPIKPIRVRLAIALFQGIHARRKEGSQRTRQSRKAAIWVRLFIFLEFLG